MRPVGILESGEIGFCPVRKIRADNAAVDAGLKMLLSHPAIAIHVQVLYCAIT